MTTAAQLIRKSYILANILDAEEEISGYYGSQGLDILNGIISEWGNMGIYIPVDSTVTFNTEPSVFLYEEEPAIVQFLEGNIIDSNNIKSILFLADLKQQNTFNYNLSETAPSRPKYVYIQNNQNIPSGIASYSNVYLYPVPDRIYTVNLTVKSRLSELDQSSQITNLPTFYFKPLKYQLAKELSIEFASILPDRFYEEYDLVIKNLLSINKKDMTVQNQDELRSYRRYRPWNYNYG